MESLISLCGDALLHREYPLDTSLILLQMASQHNLHQLKSQVMKVIGKNFSSLLENGLFLNLSAECLCLILSDSDISVHDERQVLHVALRWLHLHRQRLEHVEKVLRCVRLATIDFNDYELTQLKTEAVFCTTPGRQLLEQALKYRNSPADRWWMSNIATTSRVSTGRRQVIAVICVNDMIVLNEVDGKWLFIKNKFVADDINLRGIGPSWKHHVEVVRYDNDLYMAVWNDVLRLFRCTDISSGVWSQVSSLPFGGQRGSLIVAPGYLYLVGRLELNATIIYRLNLATIRWEEAPEISRRIAFASGFYIDQKIYLLESKIQFDPAKCPGYQRGVHVFDTVAQSWQTFDDKTGQQNNSRSKQEVCIAEGQRPVCFKGKVYLSEDEARLCLFDIATRRFEFHPDKQYDTISPACLNGKLAYIRGEYVLGTDLESMREFEWPDLLIDDADISIVEISNSQWQRLLAEGADDYNSDNDSSVPDLNESRDDSVHMSSPDSYAYNLYSYHARQDWGWDSD